MKTIIVFHSVCGNTYLLAKAFYNNLIKQKKDVKIFRVLDPDLEDIKNIFPIANELYNEIVNIPIVTPEDILDCENIILGCPTYFGNVSAEMKAFMDSTAIFWTEARLAGKKLTAFTTTGTAEGGGGLCLQSINTFGLHMGMIPTPIPSTLNSQINLPAYGFIHYTGDNSDVRPTEHLYSAIENYTKTVL
jgi:NAD(P)H dehydrogenase (quinone)